MKGTTVRVPARTHAQLTELAEAGREPLVQVLTRAVERYYREQWIAAANEEFAALRAEPEAWAAYTADMALFDQALGDGLEDVPWMEQ